MVSSDVLKVLQHFMADLKNFVFIISGATPRAEPCTLGPDMSGEHGVFVREPGGPGQCDWSSRHLTWSGWKSYILLWATSKVRATTGNPS